MKRSIARMALATFAFGSSLVRPAPAQEAPTRLDLSPVGTASAAVHFAPADVTFGHYHLSIMGIGNEIALAGARFGDATEREELESGAFAYVVDAMRDWERKYPGDPEIPRDLLRVVHVYHKLHSAVGREFADRAAAWLEHDYPESTAAATAKSELSGSR